MNHIKNYKLFESQVNSDMWDIHEILLELFDEYKYTKHIDRTYIGMSSVKHGSIQISQSWYFGASCLRVRITQNSLQGNLKKGVHKGFDGLRDENYKELLEEANDRIIDMLNPVKVEIGQVGIYTKDLDLVYFSEKPKYIRGVDVYGSNLVTKLEKYDITLVSNSRHDNMFDAIGVKGFSVGNFYLIGYGDDSYFYILEPREQTRFPGYDYIMDQWEAVCEKKNIKNGQRIRNIDNP